MFKPEELEQDIKNQGLEKVWDENKGMITEMTDKAPSAKSVAAIVENAIEQGFVIGAAVKLKGTERIGEITSHNHNTSGFYPGDRYPIVVKSEKGTFEYSANDLEVI